MDVATTLDGALLAQSPTDWPFHVHLNRLHAKFQNVAEDDILDLLGSDQKTHEYKSLYIRDIIAQHAPHLLTEKIKVILDPSQPLWRRSSAHASVLLNSPGRSSVRKVPVGSVPLSLPVGSRTDYLPEDTTAVKQVSSMSADELAMYANPESVEPILKRGSAFFGELRPDTQEGVLTSRLFDVVAKSRNQALKDEAGERNYTFIGVPPLQHGDYVHATRPDILHEILSNGLRCGEAVVDNDRSIINFPFTVSFLEIDEDIAARETTAERLAALRNAAYGAINVVLHRGVESTDYGLEQRANVPNQRQIFGGVPSTEVKAIVIREQNDDMEMQSLVEQVIATVNENGMFIPVYNSKGELLLARE